MSEYTTSKCESCNIVFTVIDGEGECPLCSRECTEVDYKAGKNLLLCYPVGERPLERGLPAVRV